jgi:mannose-1-phosphate guanylyltransferase/phosphomannomutase
MKAIVLAAGKGTRLGNLTHEIPKPMLPVNGRPVLEHIISWLKINGFLDIGVNLYTMPKQISDYFGDGSKMGVNIHYVYETRLSGTAGAIPKFKDWLHNDDNFLVVYGDILTDQPLSFLIDAHNQHNAFATLLMHRRKASNSFIELGSNGRIVNFIERPDDIEMKKLGSDNPQGFLVNSAVQILSHESLDYIISNDCSDLPRDVYAPNCKTKNIYGVELTGKRVAIDSPERYKSAGDIFP